MYLVYELLDRQTDGTMIILIDLPILTETDLTLASNTNQR